MDEGTKRNKQLSGIKRLSGIKPWNPKLEDFKWGITPTYLSTISVRTTAATLWQSHYNYNTATKSCRN